MKIKSIYEKNTHLNFLSLQNQLEYIRIQVDSLKDISVSTFRNFVKKHLRRSFKKIHYVSRHVDSAKNKMVRSVFFKLMVGFLFSGYVVCFTDSSALSSSSLKPYGWGEINQRVYAPSKSVNKRRHFLTAMSQFGIELCLITESAATSMELMNFYSKLCSDLKKKYRKKRIVVILDNAKKLHTQSLKSIAESHKVLFLYTASSSPQLHPIEALFEQAKRNIRRNIKIPRWLIFFSLT